MTRIVRPSTQVIAYAKRLAPEPRRAIKQELANLCQERGDIRALEANLSGYYRRSTTANNKITRIFRL